ncbi:hypothetical protein IJ096_01540 [Candidatus Saccharibacteria bacterium]|nr:hypothetical protein [Candidatus Saccharibacteria bacterium]
MIRTVIVPTITTADPKVYQSQFTEFPKFTKRIQLDIADGEFTPVATLPLSIIRWPEGLQIDLHMLVLRPSEHLKRILELKPSLCILHAEANEDLTPTFDTLAAAGIKTGLALLKTTYPGRVKAYIEKVDHVLIFSGNLGQQGGTADMLQIEKVPLIRAIKSDLEIGWDGGANLKNARAIAQSDIDVINVGSAITNAADPAAAFKALSEDLDKRGVVL